MSGWRDNRWTREPETRRAAWWSLGGSALVIALFGWMLAESLMGRTSRPMWIDVMLLVPIAANAAFALSALRRLSLP